MDNLQKQEDTSPGLQEIEPVPSGSAKAIRDRNSASDNSSDEDDDIVLAFPGDDNEDSEDKALLPKTTENLVPEALDGGYGWVIVFVAFLSNFVFAGISVSQSALMEDIRKASGIVNTTSNGSCIGIKGHTNCTLSAEPVYEITVAMYGLITSVLFCVTLTAGPLISLMVDKYGFRKVAITGSLLSATGIFSSWIGSYAGKPNIWVTIFCFGGIGGLGFGMMFQSGIIILGLYFDKLLPLANGIALMGTGFGTIIFPPLLSIITKTWSWKEAYLFQAGMCLFSAFFAFFYRPLPMKPTVSRTYGATSTNVKNEAGIIPDIVIIMSEASSSEQRHQIASAPKATMGSLLKTPTFLLLSISGGIAMLGIFGSYAFLVDRAMKDINGVDERTATFLLSIVGIVNTSGRLIFGIISCHPGVDSLIFSNAALTVSGLAIMMVPFTTTYYEMVIICVVFGFALSIVAILRPVVVSKLMGVHNFNLAFGMSLPFMGVGALIGIPLGGWLKDSTGRYDISFYAAGGYLALAGILCYPLQRLQSLKRGFSKESPETCRLSPNENVTPRGQRAERLKASRMDLRRKLFVSSHSSLPGLEDSTSELPPGPSTSKVQLPLIRPIKTGGEGPLPSTKKHAPGDTFYEQESMYLLKLILHHVEYKDQLLERSFRSNKLIEDVVDMYNNHFKAAIEAGLTQERTSNSLKGHFRGMFPKFYEGKTPDHRIRWEKMVADVNGRCDDAELEKFTLLKEILRVNFKREKKTIGPERKSEDLSEQESEEE